MLLELSGQITQHHTKIKLWLEGLVLPTGGEALWEH